MVKDLKYLKSKNATRKAKVGFKVTELTNYIKMFLDGELPNSATYFTAFPNVNQSGANDYKKTFGVSLNYIWKSFAYSKRVEDNIKLEAKRKLMEI